MTGAGGGLLAAGAVLVVLGSLLGYHELVLLGAVALATVAVAFAWVTRPVTLTTRQSLSRQQVERGETASLRMDIHNASARAVGTLLVTVRFFIDRGRVADAQMRGKRAGSALSRRRDIERTVDHIGGQSSATVWTQLPTDTRGIVRIAAFLSRSDPFGLLKWQKTFGVSSQMWVGPRTVRLTSMPAGVIADAEGINSDTAEEGSISFKAIGEYRRGDDIRRIHWPSVARTGKLMVRQYVDTGRPSFIVAVNIDESSYENRELFEAAVDSAASVVRACAERRFPVKLVMEDRAGDAASSEHIPFRRLALVQPGAQASVKGLVEQLRRRSLTGFAAIFTGSLDTEQLRRLAGLRGRFTRLVIFAFGDVPAVGRQGSRGITVVRPADVVDFAALWNGLAV